MQLPLRWILALGLCALGALVLWRLYRTGQRSRTPAPVAVLKAIQRDELSFLVTDKVTTTVVLSSQRHSALLGAREAHLIAKVRLYYGTDLSRLTVDAVRIEDDRVVVTVPEPTELDFSVDLSSIRVLTKRSGLVVIKDWLDGTPPERELYAALHDAAREYLTDEGLAPTRDVIVQRLNVYAPALSQVVGRIVRFE